MNDVRVGVDLVQVSRVAESLEKFGERFLRRIFTDAEVAYATSAGPALAAERLATRFAAKEAAIKALGLGDEAMGWRDIEVRRTASGAPEMALHGVARRVADESGVGEVSVSLSRAGDYATAVVVTRVTERRDS